MSESFSVQQRNESVEPIIGGMSFPITFWSDDGIAPGWNASDRDSFLRTFWRKFGNDILQAFLAVSVAKVQTQNWVIEGPELLATFCQTMMRDDADFERGWSYMIARGVQDYYTQDNGWFMERMRAEPGDYEGPCLGLAHLDSARMKPSGNESFPYYYMSPEGEYHLMHKSQIIRIVDMPTPETGLHHHMRGFCALSRALSTAMVLTLLVAMKREKLSDLPPSALAVFNNINKRQFDSALSVHAAEQTSKGNAVWKTLLPLFGIDPAHPADVKFISLREVWEGFDEMTAYNVAVYSFAAAWRMDPREVWPVSSGPLGTGKEAEVQHEKAKGKSFGLLFTEIERAFNNNKTLPKEISFKFQLEDSEEEQLRAAIHQTQIGNVKSMQEAGANLTPQEVRRLLSLEYHILPRNMMNVPAEALAAANQGQPVSNGNKPSDEVSVDDVGRIPIGSSSPSYVSVDDVERQTKEYGMYLGKRVTIDSAGTLEYVDLHFYNFYPHAKEYSDGAQSSGDLIPVKDIITRIGKLPITRRKAVGRSMSQIQTALGAEKRMQDVEAIPESVFESEGA